MNEAPKKSLGQHWLVDDTALSSICQQANLTKNDTVLEIGPGQGALTKHLVQQVGLVIAVEFDDILAQSLKTRVKTDNLRVINQDILNFDFSSMPLGYKIVANIPYYLTSHLFRLITQSTNLPASAVILVQKEIAERICASQGQMSVLAVSIQVYFNASLGSIVPSSSFDPAPKVDSQVVILQKLPNSLVKNLDEKLFFRIVKAGFSAKRKKLRSSLSAGLGMEKLQAEQLLSMAEIDPNLRAQNLSLNDWHSLYHAYAKIWN